MASSSKNKGYTQADIERYHSGKMPANEMHALEKAAMEDPFLADALEGYAFTDTPSEDLKIIRQRLQEKTETKKAIPLFSRSLNWMKVAALVLVLAGSGWLIFYLQPDKNNSLAVEATDKKIQSENSRIFADTSQSSNYMMPGMDSISMAQSDNTNTAFKVNENNKQESPAVGLIAGEQKNQTREWKSGDSKTETFANVNPTSVQPQGGRQEDVAIYRQGDLNASRRDRSAESNVSNRAAPDPNANNVLSRIQVTTDTQNNKGIASNMQVKDNDTIMNLNVVMKEAEARPAEVVVVGYGQKKKSGINQLNRVIIDTLEPAEGYTQFDDYIATHIKSPDELKIKPVNGEVQLSFDVNKKGEPVNITVVKSLCEKCDEEAIRLLKEGPKWKKKKSKKGKLTIKF